MWGAARPVRDENVHVRLMGALAVGKTTMVSTAVTRTAQKRSMPYTPSRHTQRFVCSSRAPSGETIVAELVDTKGNKTVESLLNEFSANPHQTSDEDGGGEETKSLLGKEERQVRWCYIVVFDFTRHDTYLHAKKVIERIRSIEWSLGRGVQSVIFLVGNKREMCAAATLSAWLRDHQNTSDKKDANLFMFAGSALENSFVSTEPLGSDKVGFIERTYGLRGGDEVLHYRMSMDQLIFLLKARVDSLPTSVPSYHYPRPSSSASSGSSAAKDGKKYVDDDDDRSSENGDCCTKCSAWCCRRGRRKL